ncbi:hypothetical protein HY29_15910 [Hyphomonas beringensis]|uniref:AsmA domain-containing protein n=1 Tax=Hyphomonas beringensis TaxID=1280946 RepID=A0A062UCA7_9PROT|nr:AsmA family protein [Hyphomonas beringensis]KCZ53755.1 hypothetical protein HY29_15910 [Hyphomonas beringensis]
MKRILLICGAVLAVLLIAALTVPFFVPKSAYKTRIETAATNALNRDVELTGDVSISIFPRISASIDGVTVANPEGFAREDMIKAGELRGSVKWLPLLSGKVDVQQITFVDADVFLQKRADGETNWQFGTGKAEEKKTASEGGGSVKASIDHARLQNASLTYQDDSSGKTYELKDFNLQASLRDMDKPLAADADGKFQDHAFDLSLELDSPDSLLTNAPTEALLMFEMGDIGKISFQGTLQLGDNGNVDGGLRFSSGNLPELIAFTGITPPVNVEPLGTANIVAKVSGPLSALVIDFEQMGVKSDVLMANYTGKVTLGEPMSLDGQLSVDSAQAGELTRELGLEIPASSALEKVKVSSKIKGPVDALVLSNISANHTGALLNATYYGDVSLAGNGRIDGNIDAKSDKLRDLLKAADVDLPPGETLQRFSTKGDISGTFQALTINKLNFALDDITATGTAGVNLSGDKPRLTGNLDMGNLDLTPFLSSEEAATEDKPASTGWSKEPLDLAGLKSVNADLNIHANTLTLGEVKLTDAVLVAKLLDGKLTADLSKFGAFGGNWAGKMIVDARQAKPAVAFDMTGNNVLMSDMLGTLASFDRLTGKGELSLDASGSGDSIDEIMNALDGKVSANLEDGALKGINVAQLVRTASSLKSALSSGGLAGLDLSSAVSSSAETDFTNFDTILTINKGVANVDVMKLLNPVLGVDGSGKINLGGQSLDLRLATSIDKSGKGDGSVVQLNGIPVPIRVSGSWTNVKVSPDLSGVQSALEAELGNRLRDELTKRLGGGDGSSDESSNGTEDVINGILGIQNKDEADTNEADQKSDEDKAIEAIGNLFGRKSNED